MISNPSDDFSLEPNEEEGDVDGSGVEKMRGRNRGGGEGRKRKGG